MSDFTPEQAISILAVALVCIAWIEIDLNWRRR